MARVILMEHDDTVTGLVTDTLRSAGHEVHTPEDLNGLLVRVAEGADLVIADADTDASPQGIVSSARALRPGLPILLTTTFVEPLQERLLLQFGADAVLQKPFDLPTFLSLVEILSSKQTRRPTLY